MSFAYPPNRLSVRTDQTVIRLRHSVPWTHPDPCDFKGDAPQLQALTDFNVSFEVVESTLLPAITRTEGSDYIVKEFFPDGRFTPRDDSFVTAANMGTLSGYHVYSGIEGCGRHAYYFPTPTGRTLVVLRQFIAEFNPVNGDTDQVRALSGVILPDVEDQLFVKVMESVRFRQ